MVVALFAIFATYAAVFALGAHGAESVWGAWAAGGYSAAAAVAIWSWRRHPSVSLLVALAGAFAVPAAVLPDNWGATSEVRVVARAATLSLAHGTPYLASNQLVSWRSYDPYLPGMSLFGLPHALGFPGLFGDPLIWLVIATVALLAAACRIASPGAARRCHHCRYQALLRALLLLSCPVFALPMSLGVTDPPVIALICLGLAWTARNPHTHPAPAGSTSHEEATGHSQPRVTRWRRGHLLLSGAAIGAACALKATAWPALPVVVALVAVRDGRYAAARFAGSSLGSFLMLIALTAPALLTQPSALWQNIVAYPLGLSRRLTPAASPLPGHLLAGAGSLGHLAAIVLLGGAAFAMGASLVRRPPGNVQQASVRLVIGLAAMFLLAPDARLGYFAYPLGILSWLILTVVNPRRARDHEAAPGKPRTSGQFLAQRPLVAWKRPGSQSACDPPRASARGNLGWLATHRAALVAALSITLVTALCLWFGCSYQDDFHVYLAGAHDLFSGTLYSQSTRGELFTYPPFAALLFVPLERLPSTIAAQVLWALLTEAALLGLLILSIRAACPDLPRRSRRLWALGLSAPAFFLDPVLLAIRHGQVNVLITFLVVWDLVGARRLGRKTVPLGVATGLAAAIKVTPLIFVPYLVLTRRSKAAWCCIGTFVAAEAITCVISPGASKEYWAHDLFDYKRVGGYLGLRGLFAPTNQSLLGALARINHGAVSAGLLWTVAGVFGVLGVVLASYVHRHWSSFLGVALCSATGLLISPVTWTHQMVWVIPVVVWLGRSPDRPGWGRPAAAFTTVLFWVAPIWWVANEGKGPLHERGWQLIAGNSFFLWMVLLLVASAASVFRRTRLVAFSAYPGGPGRRPGSSSQGNVAS